jgi:hypothetical protein
MNYNYVIPPEINYKKFRPTETDMDRREYTRQFTGRMTKERYSIIDRYCRKASYTTGYCGHEWDCCGCLCSQSLSFTYKQNQTIITLVQTFNY